MFILITSFSKITNLGETAQQSAIKEALLPGLCLDAHQIATFPHAFLTMCNYIVHVAYTALCTLNEIL